MKHSASQTKQNVLLEEQHKYNDFTVMINLGSKEAVAHIIP